MIGKIFFKRALVGATALTVSVAGVLGSSATSFAATPTAAPSAAAGTSATAPTHQKAGARFIKELVSNTSKETGLDAKTIRNRLGAGQSFNKIAGDKAGTVEQDVLNDVKARLDKAVASGKMTQAQEDAALAKAKTAVEKVMSADLSKYFSHSSGHGQGGGQKNSQAF